MRHLLLTLFAVFIGLSLPLHDAEAKRFGGGKSSGMQRDSLPQRQATPQRNADDAGNPANPGQAGAANAAGKRNWLGPVAGLAAGLGLAALASHLGLGEEFANLLLIALLVMGAFLLFRWLTRNRAQPARGMQYAGAGPALGGMPPVGAAGQGAALPGSPAALSGAAQAAGQRGLPAGFDATAFAREAKLNFLRLQAAYDAGNLDDIRDFTSPEMYAEIQLQLRERGQASQRTEVLNLEAEVLDCVEEPQRLIVSVRFHGLIREEADAPAHDFDEVWHLTRPSRDGGGWVVAGIQQSS